MARQPIFNSNKKVEFYELLFRSNVDNWYKSYDDDKATLDVMANSFTLIGINKLTNGKRAFINFTEKLILEEIPLVLPADKIAIEILESVTISEEVIKKCLKFKELGYIIVLDDFVFQSRYEPLIDIADYIKVDFIKSAGVERKHIIENCKNKGIKFIAEKVETVKDFNEAVALGFTYFQGYFFSKPKIISSRELPASKAFNLNLLKAINRNEDFKYIEDIIKTDVALTYKLLKFINSAHYGLRVNICSISQALALLGIKELTKWATLVTFKEICEAESRTLLEVAIIRARFAENIAIKVNLANRASEIFTMQIISILDQLLNQSMEQILLDLPLEEDIKAALLGEDNIFQCIGNLIISYERADWDSFSCYLENLTINEEEVPAIYAEAIEWTSQFI